MNAGLAGKKSMAKTEDYAWLNRFGNLGTFLKNDIKLIRRNKRSKTAVIMSFFFIFYGLLFFTGGIEAYDGPVWKIFAGIFISGGFLFSFGQFVPSWDSSYYPLMMSQNIRYREYLTSKWYLIIMATAASTILASFYIYFGWDAYLAVIVGAIYNIGVNSYLVLWGGAYIKTPIDLTSNKKAFGDKQAFNSKTLLLTLPKLILPLGVYALGHYLISPTAGYIFVGMAGVIGFGFRNKVFAMIESIYKKEKYKTLAAYKQKT
jgi:multisubunit Na+/H+ antiporter MnhC subunit